jgi:hypothetical protein
MSQHAAKTPRGSGKASKSGKPGSAAKPPIDLAAVLAQVLESEGYKIEGPGSRRLKGKTKKFTPRSVIASLLAKTPVPPPAKAEKLRDAVRRHRNANRQKGMKLVQFWVPDTSAPGFAEEARRQSALIAAAAADPTSDEAQMNRELDAWAGGLSAAESDYEWGPKGPPK